MRTATRIASRHWPGCPTDVDLVVVGLGVTGAGVALDAVTRGLSVLAVDAHDLAFGTSRWSSKLVHGGLRYLAHGQVGVAHESAVERGILMEVTAPAPHPRAADAAAAHPGVTHGRPRITRGALPRRRPAAARRAHRPRDAARRRAGSRPPRPCRWRPALRPDGLRGGLLSWDGQLEDDARLVTTIARTAAGVRRPRAHPRPGRCTPTGRGVRLRDELTGEETAAVAARAVVNATGVWAGGLVAEVRLRPSRGTHLVLRAESLPGLRVCVTAPDPGQHQPVRAGAAPARRHASTSASPTSRSTARSPTCRSRPRPRSASCSTCVSPRFDTPAAPRRRGRRVRRPAAAARHRRAGATADLSRRHAVLTSPTGVVTVVGGKLTTYRRMAEDAVDAALAAPAWTPRPCRTRRLPLLGAADRPRGRLAAARGLPPRLVRRYGTDAGLVLATAREVTGLADDELLAPVADGTCRPPWPSWSSASPTRAPPTSATCSTGVPGSAWSPPTATLRRAAAAERALASCAVAGA